MRAQMLGRRRQGVGQLINWPRFSTRAPSVMTPLESARRSAPSSASVKALWP
jgi:hypothetical protein